MARTVKKTHNPDWPAYQAFIDTQTALESRIIGQQKLVERLLLALLADGHMLVEGAPGLAKTTAVKALSEFVEGSFHRVQFTPDLLPADLTGTEIFRPQDGSFEFRSGPLFHNIVLADEVNRAPAKVQAALLEAMAERQITVGSETYPLPELFLVMATQNPIEQEGTYPLPEAQLDRFLLYVRIGYPDLQSEREILKLAREQANQSASESTPVPVLLDEATIKQARAEVGVQHFSDELENYILQLVQATREPAAYGDDLARWLRWGASPRATIALERVARAHSWLSGRDYVSPDDVQAIAHDILRHRILLSFEAESEGMDTDRVIDAILERVAVP